MEQSNAPSTPSSEADDKLWTLSISKAAVIFPAFHLVLAVIYLTLYVYTFGSSISPFIDISDVIRIGIVFSAPVYIFGFPAAIYSLANKIEFNSWLPNHNPEFRTSENYRKKVTGMSDLHAKIQTIAMIVVIIAGIIVSVITYILKDILSLVPLTMTAIIIIAISFQKWGYLFPVGQFEKLLCLFGLIFLCVVSTRGVEDGYRDRHAKYSDPNFLIMSSCDENTRIIKRIGEFYLGINKFSKRILVDQDCRIKFRL